MLGLLKCEEERSNQNSTTVKILRYAEEIDDFRMRTYGGPQKSFSSEKLNFIKGCLARTHKGYMVNNFLYVVPADNIEEKDADLAISQFGVGKFEVVEIMNEKLGVRSF